MGGLIIENFNEECYMKIIKEWKMWKDMFKKTCLITE